MKFQQDQRVYFDMGRDKPKGFATVQGVVGFIVIIKPDEIIPEYPYSCIYVVDSQLSENEPIDIPIIDETSKEENINLSDN